MKKFLIGVVVGIILATTGAYAIIKKKVKEKATMENAEKVVKATEELGDTIKNLF